MFEREFKEYFKELWNKVVPLRFTRKKVQELIIARLRPYLLETSKTKPAMYMAWRPEG